LAVFLHAHAARQRHFPYTTLFRSRPLPLALPLAIIPLKCQTIFIHLGRVSHIVRCRPNLILTPDLPRSLIVTNGNSMSIHASWGDRKSTRLNSSHVKISYAVLCLK